MSYRSYKLPQSYSLLAHDFDENTYSWVLTLRPMTYKIRIPEELGDCKIVDQETSITLGQTFNSVFTMPDYIFTLLPRSRIVGCSKEYLQAGPLEESHLLGETVVRIYADPTRVKDLCMLSRNMSLSGFYPNETFTHFNFSATGIKDNLFYSDEVDAIFRLSD